MNEKVQLGNVWQMSEVRVYFNEFSDVLWDDFIRVLSVLRKHKIDANIHFGIPEGCEYPHIIVWTGENIIPEDVELELLKCSKRILVG